MMSRLLLSFFLFSGAASCASPPQEPVGSAAAAITGGTSDATESAVVWIVGKFGGKDGYCSGVVVSPHVVLTAAHCSQVNAEYSIFLGSDYTNAAAKADPAQYVKVTAHHAHPDFSMSTLINDVGVLITTAPIPRSPAAINRAPLVASDRGATIRLVGFGQTSGTDKTIGQRHEATTTLADYDGNSIVLQGTPSFCLFDSGGPTFMRRDGAEVVIGIHSVVEAQSCDAKAWDERVDANAAFIDGFLEKDKPPVEAGVDDAGADAEADAEADAGVEAPAASPPASSGCSMGASGASRGDIVLAFALSLFVAGAARSRRWRRVAVV